MHHASCAVSVKLPIYKTALADTETNTKTDTKTETETDTETNTETDTKTDTKTITNKAFSLSVKPIYRPMPIPKLYRSFPEQWWMALCGQMFFSIYSLNRFGIL